MLQSVLFFSDASVIVPVTKLLVYLLNNSYKHNFSGQKTNFFKNIWIYNELIDRDLT